MGKLFAVVLTIITIISAGIFIAHVWWLPPDISTTGHAIDHQLTETLIASGILFVAAQFALAIFVWRFGDRKDARPVRIFPGGPVPLVVAACVLVGAEIVVLSFVGTKIWSRIYFTAAPANALQVDVQAEQFAFYFRYPGPDGKFGTIHPELIDEGNYNFFGLDPANDVAARDDIVTASLAVPVNRPVLLTLHAKDVSHNFFVPALRIQQDFVPGLVIPIHFTATQTAHTEIVCTQLCGLGHYNMRAYLDVMTPDKFDAWLQEQAGY